MCFFPWGSCFQLYLGNPKHLSNWELYAVLLCLLFIFRRNVVRVGVFSDICWVVGCYYGDRLGQFFNISVCCLTATCALLMGCSGSSATITLVWLLPSSHPILLYLLWRCAFFISSSSTLIVPWNPQSCCPIVSLIGQFWFLYLLIWHPVGSSHGSLWYGAGTCGHEWEIVLN